ncbi:glycosyltransferase family 2 protein [Frigoriflavimonas asaccharolytica]|uniref:Glycosyltransferase involved in cell wall biosynthesis n=1 Tax=Frigoriflavimonas asaccharolytica TaxID=2735899 RepID=A0A8J8KCA6_9FLAO|nr:glycosyltransferase family 2 protein [Frigoriflavimonas asaccharolytica]NRS93409.1 glycosyltransferase involved in cell wall biosynthesis [Frigoriflavimonas asaccharolytica]
MQLKEKISGLIITYNEEKNIREVLECFHFCDEIIIIDSYSTDKTLEIASAFSNVKIIKNKFEDFTKQRNLALENASNDWILFLDGDERITPKLEAEIIVELNKDDKKDAYYFYRKSFFEGKALHFSGTRNDKNFRLFRKSKASYIAEKKVHETLLVNGEIGFLENKLLHYSIENHQSYKKKMLEYGRLKGVELFEKGKKYNLFTHYWKTFFKFFKSYILQLGILDGKNGFYFCKMQAEYVDFTHATVKQLESKI